MFISECQQTTRFSGIIILLYSIDKKPSCLKPAFSQQYCHVIGLNQSFFLVQSPKNNNTKGEQEA